MLAPLEIIDSGGLVENIICCQIYWTWYNVYNVKADDADYIIRELYRQDLVEFASKSADKFDFSKINFNGIPSRYYTISGKIKL